MSQLIAVKSAEGILFLADRRVEIHEDDGTVSVRSMRKLYPLGKVGLLSTSGSAVGIEFSRKLSVLFRESPLSFEEMKSHVLDTFQNEYDRFKEEGRAWFAAHPEAHRLSYILLGGIHENGTPEMSFYGSESHEEKYREIGIADVLAAPRRMGIEMKLATALKTHASLKELANLSVQGLYLIEEKEKSVGRPFDCGIISRSGINLETFGEPRG